ncbi:hypothetical protein SAMN05216223_101170 [Actinacidiphila yanglinensis]|uniref:Uncharacterized protein n=1 Tax=Actinacidiphila yanglinensis TaxID=310779 RepID=A0A1H5SKQ7_9ACTN|nr:hypothetical protein [Actinacidiphila yanglinensis]SEF51034.1 hypothetical protein SAMN05216223_101170 [Actinacidiphila yanglinensis]
MNIRSLTRGDGVVIGSAALLLIASFLPFYSYPSGYSVSGGVSHSSQNLWHSATFPILPSVTLAAVVAAAALLFARSGQLAGRQVLGLSLDQWVVALSLFVGWTAVWSTLFNNQDGVDKKVGAWLTLIFGIVIAVAAALSSRLPALKAPLMGAPQQPQPYGVGAQQPYGMNPPQAGYGYPGGAQSVDPAYGGAPAPQPPYGGGPVAAAPHAAQPTAAAPAPSADFTAFWFAVPVPRPLFAEDGSGGQIAELAPGTWYLAVDQRGQALIAQTQDGRRGVLQDSSGIQRG